MRKITICLLLLLLLGGAAGGAFYWHSHTQAKEREMRHLAERQSASLDQETPAKIPVDFGKLQKANPDIYAWITIPGTGIDEPVLQKEDDGAYYLTHSWQGQESLAGAVFSESAYNGRDLEDAHTVLYGKGTEDGAVFSGLYRFEDEQFFDEHRLIAVYTPEAIRYYQIFAAYEYDSRHLLQSFDCSNPTVFEQYIESILTQRNLYAHIDQSVSVSEGDRILTLSTGSSMQKGNTYLVQGVLNKKIILNQEEIK